MFAAVESLPPRWIAVGACAGGGATAVFGPDCAATFAGFGVDLPVRLSPRAHRPAGLPLCALMAGWVRGQVRPDDGVQVRSYADTDTAPAQGVRLRAELDRSPEPVGVLVVADGANTLTPPAPGGYHPADLEVQQVLDDALADGDIPALTRLPGQVVGRAAFALLAGLAGPGPRAAKEFYRGAPYGVGYFAGVWQP